MEQGFILNEKLTVKIKNFKSDPLFAYPEHSIVTFKSDVQGKKAKMYMYVYKDLAGCDNGVPVVISCSIDNKTYLLCVASNSLILKENEVPEEIQSEASEFLFYQRDFLAKLTTFESSVKSRFFLAWSEEDSSLILQPYEDKPDLFAAFFLEVGHVEIYKRDDKDPMKPYHFWNSNNELLIAHPEESIATFEPDEHTKEEEATFFMVKYKENGRTGKGLPMAINCKVKNKNYLLWGANNSVILKESELPETILTKTNELIFYRRYFSSGQSSYRFESSFSNKYCLAWSMEGSEKKLILKKYSESDIDETMKFELKETTNNESTI